MLVILCSLLLAFPNLGVGAAQYPHLAYQDSRVSITLLSPESARFDFAAHSIVPAGPELKKEPYADQLPLKQLPRYVKETGRSIMVLKSVSSLQMTGHGFTVSLWDGTSWDAPLARNVLRMSRGVFLGSLTAPIPNLDAPTFP